MYQIWTQDQAKQDDRPKEPGRNAHESDSNYHKGATPSPPVCLSPGTVVFFLLINSSLFSLLSFFVEILCKAEGPGPLSLTTGLVARISCFYHLNVHPTCDWEPKPPPSCSEEEKLKFYITSYLFCLCNSACSLQADLDHDGHEVSESEDLQY